MTSIAVAAEVCCPFSATLEYVDVYHKQRSSDASVAYTHVAHVRCDASEIRDVTDDTRVHDALLFRWNSRFPMLPPVLHGLITVRPHGRTTQIRLEATYVPRFGPLGVLIDAVAGRMVVRNMLQAFLADVRRFVENAYDLERMLQPHMYAIRN